MTDSSLDTARKRNKKGGVSSDYGLNESELLCLTKIRRLTATEEKLISILEELKFTRNLFYARNVILNFKHITDLTLNHIAIEFLPNQIKNLHNLMHLDLSNNKLTYLPNSLALLNRLTWLNLSNNKLCETPNILYTGLRFLKILDLSCNAITEFNDPPVCVGNLLHFRMSNNALNEIPAWLFSPLCHLEVLDLSLNPIKNLTHVSINSFGPGIYDSLQILNIENCNVICRKLHYLKYFKKLELLQFGNKTDINNRNFLGSLTMDIFENVKRLKCLYIENSDIVLLPQQFGQLQCVQHLNLSDNKLSWLPDSFCDLINLKVIYLCSNQLIFLPENIDNLKNLEELHLNNNKLSKLPTGFYKLHNLKYLDLYDNEITKIDAINFKELTMLNGLDLELNFLDFDILEWPELNITKEKYCSLKTCFRNHFNVSQRNDLHKNNIIDDYEEVIDSLLERNSDISDFIEEEEEVKDFSIEVADKNILEASETWEENSGDDKHASFEPRYATWNEDNSIKCPTIKLENYNENYCPAVNHSSSLLNICSRNFSLYNEIAEGQFDSE